MSTDHDGIPPDNVELYDLAAGRSPHSGQPSRPRRRNVLRLGTALLALALLAGALILSARVPGSTVPVSSPTATPAAPFLPPTGLGCIRDAAWAPTGELIAFVGPSLTDCSYGVYSANVVNVYRAQTNRLVRQLHPDPAIFAALGLRQPAPTTPAPGGNLGLLLIYSTLRWSPDGSRLALSFNLVSPGSDPSARLDIYGLVLLDADGSHERVLVDRQTSYQAAYTVWDTQSGTTVAVPPDTISADAPYSTFIPAQSYSWGADGTLVARAPFTVSTAPSSVSAGLVGNPIGFSPFGLWQPGYILALEAPTSGQEPPSYLYLFTTTFSSWSPDGRYLADGLSVRGLLPSAGTPLPPPSVLSTLPLQLQHVAALPIRDAALSEALAHDLPLPSSNPGQSGVFANIMPTAWRPDGKVLAELTEHNGYILRATDSGQVVKSVDIMNVPPEALAPPGSAGSWDAPLWSPDGKWLLLPTLALVNTSHLGV